MSGQFRDDQHTTIEATDNEALAKAHGLTEFDETTGQWRRPKSAADAEHRDGTAYGTELAELREQLAENERRRTELALELDEERAKNPAPADDDPKTPAKATGQKTTGSK